MFFLTIIIGLFLIILLGNFIFSSFRLGTTIEPFLKNKGMNVLQRNGIYYALCIPIFFVGKLDFINKIKEKKFVDALFYHRVSFFLLVAWVAIYLILTQLNLV